MDDIFETINFDELDFLQLTENDITLSQICDPIEKEKELIDGMHAFTNRSGKRTCFSQLHSAGMDEQAIMERMGHRSERAVQKYKRYCQEVSENVSKNVDPPAPKIFKTEATAPCGENTHIQETVYNENLPETKLDSIGKAEKRAMTDLTKRGFKFENCKIVLNFLLRNHA